MYFDVRFLARIAFTIDHPFAHQRPPFGAIIYASMATRWDHDGCREDVRARH